MLFILTDKITAFRVDYPHVDLKTAIRLDGPSGSERLSGTRGGIILMKRYAKYPEPGWSLVADQHEVVKQIAMQRNISFIEL